jgi:predicted nucleic acid-binding protein
MIVVDASCLYEVLTGARYADVVREEMARDEEFAAPHLIDAEVLSVIRRDHLLGRLDRTAAHQAVEDLRNWPGERWGHKGLMDRAWELRDTIRSWDALYVALAEALESTLITLDSRLGRAHGLACRVTVIGPS